MTEINPVTDYQVEDGVAVVTIDSPPVNALGHQVRLGIREGLARAFSESGVDAIVLICGGRTFFAGADITEFGKPLASPVLREIAVLMEESDKPIVAAIHGTALGGGLETALACHWRIAVPSAKLGLPEVKLGLLAGAGGTQRLPRLVGAARALDMVVSGDPIAARTALDWGLIDALAETDLRSDAVRFARDVGARPDRLRRVRDLPPPEATAALFAEYRTVHAERLAGFEAPEASIRCIEAAASQSFDEGMRTERALFEDLMPGVQCAAQRYNFFAEREAAKIPGLGKEVAPLPLDPIALRGEPSEVDAAAARLQTAGLRIERDSPDALLIDVGPDVRDGTEASAARAVAVRLAPRLMEIMRRPETSDAALAATLALAKRLGLASVVTLSGDEFIGRSMAERLAVDLRHCLEDGVAPARLLDIAGRFGLQLDLADLAPVSAAAPRDLADEIILDRLLVPLINEGAHLLEEGAAARASDIDVACVKSGMWKIYRGGPMFHAGQIGLGRVIELLKTYEERWGEDYRPSPLLERAANSGATLHDIRGVFHG